MTKEVFQLEVQVQTAPALSGLDQLDKKLKGVKSTADSIGKTNSLGGLSKSVDTLKSSLSGLGTVLGALAFGKLSSDVIQVNAAYQSLQTTLETVTGSVGSAADAMKVLQDVAATTPFSINQLGDSFIKLEAAGLKPTADQLRLFSDVASVTTDKIGSLQAITDLYARTTAGGLGLEEVNRLADRGIPVFDILSKRIGVNRLQISELGKSAQGAQIILRNLEAGLKDAFSGASEKSINTLDGQIGQFRKNLEGLAVTAGNAGATQGITALTSSLNELTKSLEPIAKIAGGAIGDGFKVMAAGISEATTNTLKFVTAAATLVGGLLLIPPILKSIVLQLGAMKALAAYDLGLITKTLPKMPRTMPKLDTDFDKVKYLAGNQIKNVGGAISTAAAAGVDSLFASLTKVWEMFTRVGAAALRFVGLGALLNPWVAGITAVVGLLYTFKDTLVTVGSDSASIGELILYPFKKLYDWLGKVVSGVKQVVVEMVDFFSIKPPDWLIGLKDWALGGIVKEISAARKEQEAADKETARLAQRAADAKQQESDAQAKLNNDAQLAKDLATGRAGTLIRILDSLKQETTLIGKSKQEAERLTKEFELQNSIKQKLAQNDPTLTSAQLDAQSQLSVEEKRKIANEISRKYQLQSIAFMNDMVKANNLEISLLSQSNLERDKANKLKEIQVQLGMADAEWAKVKLGYEKEITRLQEAQATESLNKNLQGIQEETRLLKLSNDERERAVELSRIASEAGFKNVDDFKKQRQAAYDAANKAITNRQQTVVDVNATREIDNLKDQARYEAILNDKERERVKTREDLYRAIDPDGRGKKISDAQKGQIEALLEQIEASKKLQEVNKKIEDGFASLGDAVSNWALGTEGAIKRVRLALLQLALTSIFKNQIAAGGPLGSFIGGVLGGLSGARENGGPVDANKAYLVGEKRPEIFVPQTSGYIVPNTAMLNTKTGNIQVTMAPNLIVNGSVTGQTELEKMFDEFAGAMAQQTQQFVIAQRGQNGILAR